MAERQIGQLTFTDGLVNEAARANAPLQRVSELAASRDFCIGRSVHRFSERQDAKRFRAAVRLVRLPKAFADKEPEDSTLMLIREAG
jgi:hypothetical protein